MLKVLIMLAIIVLVIILFLKRFTKMSIEINHFIYILIIFVFMYLAYGFVNKKEDFNIGENISAKIKDKAKKTELDILSQMDKELLKSNKNFFNKNQIEKPNISSIVSNYNNFSKDVENNIRNTNRNSLRDINIIYPSTDNVEYEEYTSEEENLNYLNSEQRNNQNESQNLSENTQNSESEINNESYVNSENSSYNIYNSNIALQANDGSVIGSSYNLDK